MNLSTAILLYAAAGTASEGSSLISPNIGNDLRVKDIVRKRLVQTNPDVDGAAKQNPHSQSDNAAFVGKKYRVQDISYGHLISEHDSSASAQRAAQARPYSRVLHAPEWQQTQLSRNLARKKLVNAGGPGSGRHKEILTGLGYKYQGQVKSGKVSADLYKHPRSTRSVLVHSSGAWSTRKSGISDISNGTNMKNYYAQYHPSRADQAVIQGTV